MPFENVYDLYELDENYEYSHRTHLESTLLSCRHVVLYGTSKSILQDIAFERLKHFIQDLELDEDSILRLTPSSYDKQKSSREIPSEENVASIYLNETTEFLA